MRDFIKEMFKISFIILKTIKIIKQKKLFGAELDLEI